MLMQMPPPKLEQYQGIFSKHSQAVLESKKQPKPSQSPGQ